MNLKEIVSFVEDGPWCGTRPPGHPPRPRPHADVYQLLSTGETSHARQVVPELVASLWQSVQLYQSGKRLEKLGGANGELGGATVNAAEAFFDDTCGSVPWSVILYWLLHHPPHPYPQWLGQLVNAVDTATLGSKIGGELGGQLQTASRAIIKENLPTFSANAANIR
ncbi:hypothetical protein [Undibacterium sp.]|uniref:hypothetical protein n=1 Tax=Undibacterium sp. TaxID=1914977 RepID=UPI002B5DE228|nr:hypothetical protein [Undibacterium sp.]HTD04354.1 hypothetical protein [Undibacterium sp.]